MPINPDKKFRTMFEQSPLSIQILSGDGRTLQVNEAWKKLWNTPDDVIENYLLKEYNILTDPQLEKKGVTPYLLQAFNGEASIAPPILYDPAEIGQAGRARWVAGYIYPVKNEAGKVREVILIHDDVTDRIEAESARDSVVERLKMLSEVSRALSESLDYETTFARVARLLVPKLADFCLVDTLEENRKIHRVVAIHAEPTKQVLFDQLRELYPPNWDSPQPAARVIRTGAPELLSEVTLSVMEEHTFKSEHLRLIREIGIRSHIAVPLIARGRTLGAISLGMTSPRRYTQEDLEFVQEIAIRASLAIDNAFLYKQAQDAISARDEFLSIASHELKTPITSLKLQLEITQRSVNPEHGTVPAPAMLAKAIDKSTRQVDRLTALIEDLLDVSRIQSGKLALRPVETDLTQLIEEVAESYSHAFEVANCQVHLSLEPKVIGNWDRSRLEQIIVNLFSNAIKYAPGAPIQIEVRKNAERAYLVVCDSGPGIAKEKQDRVFERFERAITSRNISGLGLGLFIVKSLVEAHQGTITLESAEGMGTSFVVELPLQPKV